MGLHPCHTDMIFVGAISISFGAVFLFILVTSWRPKPDAPAAPRDPWSYVYDSRRGHWRPSDDAPEQEHDLFEERLSALQVQEALKRARGEISLLAESNAQQMTAKCAETQKEGAEGMMCKHKAAIDMHRELVIDVEKVETQLKETQEVLGRVGANLGEL
eukprot:TRINITY_DN18447_c0_g1_i3.p1 TRINITY_DN18447_c0_g1~~TRINITY_DN18447_c0_g1_i3.p1  ORF type:complete len:182 (+),score=39.41 TRINITY_DN18447_c0_g1_i3:69-548(+)